MRSVGKRVPQTVLCWHAAGTVGVAGRTVAASVGAAAEAAAAGDDADSVAEGKGHHSCVDGSMVLAMDPVV